MMRIRLLLYLSHPLSTDLSLPSIGTVLLVASMVVAAENPLSRQRLSGGLFLHVQLNQDPLIQHYWVSGNNFSSLKTDLHTVTPRFSSIGGFLARSSITNVTFNTERYYFLYTEKSQYYITSNREMYHSLNKKVTILQSCIKHVSLLILKVSMLVLNKLVIISPYQSLF